MRFVSKKHKNFGCFIYSAYLCAQNTRFRMNLLQRFIITVFLVFSTVTGWAQENESTTMAQDSLSATSEIAENKMGDTLIISLVTCTPGMDVYAHFGHTAIKVMDVKNCRYEVFNYGCFDLRAANFVIKFIQGQTNYLLDSESATFFNYRYAVTGCGVTEQILNLNTDEKQHLYDLLTENLRPENQTYLYNWLYDNCTERARDIIEKAVDGKVEYLRPLPDLTARNMLHEKLMNAPWLSFGIDLMLGTEIDQKLDRRVQMFIPDHYEAELDSAFIVRADGSRVPLLENKVQVLSVTHPAEEPFPVTPMMTFTLLLAMAFVLTYYDNKRLTKTVGITNPKPRLRFWWFDVLLLMAQGLTGIIIAYLFFFSIHPAVSTNWYVIIFNPLPILYALYIIYNVIKSRDNRQYVAIANLVVTTVFLVLMIARVQNFQLAAYPMVCAMLLRAAINYKAAKMFHAKNSNR